MRDSPDLAYKMFNICLGLAARALLKTIAWTEPPGKTQQVSTRLWRGSLEPVVRCIGSNVLEGLEAVI